MYVFKKIYLPDGQLSFRLKQCSQTYFFFNDLDFIDVNTNTDTNTPHSRISVD